MTVEAARANTVAALLRARAHDGRAGLLFEDVRFSWRDVVRESADRAALALSLRRPGPFHIGVMLDNVPDYLFWIGAAALSGATVVGINTTRRGAELAQDLRHTDCQLLVADRRNSALLDGLETGLAHERRLVIDAPTYEARLAASRGGDLEPVEVAGEDRLLLLFTSGSTEQPKAVVCTHGRVTRLAAGAGVLGITAESVCYQSMPLFHGNAILANVTPALAAGATIALRRRFSASGFIADVRRFGATYFNYVGRTLAYVLAVPPSEHDRDNQLRLGFGTEATAHDRRRFTERFGCPLLEIYGSTESGGLIVADQDTPPDALGRPPAPNMDLAVISAETRQECPPARFDNSGVLLNGDEAIGEIVDRTEAAGFEGYYNNAAAEAERFRDGWYWTGDLGYRDEEGYFYFAGRTDDRLRVDGENLAPVPIERILERHPNVAVAAVYAVPDPISGDQVMAALELVAGARLAPAALDEFLASQEDLGTKGAPRFVRIVDAMPVTANGKVSRATLRRERWEPPDLLYWRPSRGQPYRVWDAQDAQRLRDEFDAHARSIVAG